MSVFSPTVLRLVLRDDLWMRLDFPGNQARRNARKIRYRRKRCDGFPGCMLLSMLRSCSARERGCEAPRGRTRPGLPEDPWYELPIDYLWVGIPFIAPFISLISFFIYLAFLGNPFLILSLLNSSSFGTPGHKHFLCLSFYFWDFYEQDSVVITKHAVLLSIGDGEAVRLFRYHTLRG